jgi:hypothetical protein
MCHTQKGDDSGEADAKQLGSFNLKNYKENLDLKKSTQQGII